MQGEEQRLPFDVACAAPPEARFADQPKQPKQPKRVCVTLSLQRVSSRRNSGAAGSLQLKLVKVLGDQVMPCLEFNNKLGKRARVWLDDLPGGALVSNETVRGTYVFEGGSAAARWRRVAIEIFQPFGPSFHYGLLGGEYQSTEGNELEVVVPVDTPFSERLYRDALANSLDTVTVGGLAEYAGAIRSGVEQTNINARPCGTLNITCMAHGEIGSAPIMFSSLARALIATLCRSDEPSSLDEAMALLAV